MWEGSYQYNRVTSVDQLNASDLFAIWVQQNGGMMGLSLALLLEYMQDNLTITTDNMVTQYAAPSATGFTVTLGTGIDDGLSIWLVLTPVAGYAAGTLTLPLSTTVVDKQEILVNCTQSVGTLTVSGNGATVTGAPTSLSANGFFRLRYDAVLSTWYRVG